MKDKTSLGITAIICITVLEVIAMLNGINGTTFGLALVSIGGIAGYNIKGFFERKK